jgi:hypothetical protein
MDTARFDRLSQSVAQLIDRRMALRVLAGSGLARRLALAVFAGGGVAGTMASDAGDARTRKKKGGKRRCSPRCTGGRTCQKGKCRCPDDRNECSDRCCAKGEICSGGQCAACIPESRQQTCGALRCGNRVNACGDTVSCGTCGDGQVCHEGECVRRCPAEHRICDGECLPEAFCCSDAECLNNLRCIGGVCGCPDGRVQCGNRCCKDREDCIDGACKRFECEKEFPGLIRYCGPYPYNCCNKPFNCCPRTGGQINVCCAPRAFCCAGAGCCNPD